MKFKTPVKLNENIYWVGCSESKLLNQNIYLIKDEDVAVLIDPVFTQEGCILDRISPIVKLSNIKYVIIQNYEPDVLKMLEELKRLVPDIVIVTHWKIGMFLKKFGLDMNIYVIDENEWRLKLKNKTLEFIFTPFNYFAGSFCTYDKETSALFSGELFSAIKNKFQLFVDKENVYIYSLKMFHQLYLPFEYVKKALKALPEDIELVAPKYGSVLEGDFIKKSKNELLSLTKEIELEEIAEEVVSKFYEDLIVYEIDEALKRLFKNIKNAINISYLEAVVLDEEYKIGKKDTNRVDVVLQINDTPLMFAASFENLTKNEKELLRDLLVRVAKAISYVIERQMSFKKVKNNPILDTITGVFSKEYLPIVESKILKQAIRHKFPVAIGSILIDYDHTHIGKLYKECILREIAKLLQRQFRSSDIIIRDNNNFLIFMPFTDEKNASLKLSKVVKSLNNHTYCGSKKMNVKACYKVIRYDNSSIYEVLEKLKKEKVKV